MTRLFRLGLAVALASYFPILAPNPAASRDFLGIVPELPENNDVQLLRRRSPTT